MKDVNLGEFVTFGNEVFKCVKYSDDGAGNGCSYCEFKDTVTCREMKCTQGFRNDSTEVMFILYDTTPDHEDD